MSEELDEKQGLTEEMMQEWLRANGWKQTGIADALASGWELPNAGWVSDALLSPSELSFIAKVHGRTLQSLLREINPRMRPWPSLEAVEAHEKNGGRWVSKAPGDELIRCMTLSADRTEEDPVMATDDHGNDWWACDCEGWTFWPIDARGNKIRWPERDGVPL